MGMSGHAFRRSSRRCFGDFLDQRLWMVPSKRLRMAFSFDQSLKMDSENARAYKQKNKRVSMRHPKQNGAH